MTLPSDMYGTRWTLQGQAQFEAYEQAKSVSPALPVWVTLLVAMREGWHRFFVAAFLVTMFGILVWPLVMLTWGAFSATSPLEGGGHWTLDGFRGMWTEINVSHALLNSIIYAVATTSLAVAIALVLCFLSERTNVPFRRLITPVVLICAATSSLFYAIGYDLLANRFTGLINVLAKEWTGASSFLDVENWPGLIFVDALHSAAFLYLFLVGPFSNLDRSQEEAALAAGASRLRTFFTVNVRLLTPILSSVVLMGLIIGIKSFNIPLILGSPADISFLTVRILRTLQYDQPPQYDQASALALALTGLIALLLVAQYRLIGKRSYVTLTGKSFRRTRWDVGVWRRPAAAFILLYIVLGVLLPLGSIVFSSFLKFPGVYDGLTLINYRDLFANPEIDSILANTAFAAIVSGLSGVAVAFTIAYLTSRGSPVLAALLRGVTQLQLAMPGLVGALALVWAVAPVPGLRAIYGTMTLLLLAFTVSVLPLALQVAASAMRQISRELEDAARVGGASALRAALGITARLLLPSLLFGWLLAMIVIVGDLDAPLLLSAAGTRTMSIEIYKLFDGVDQSQAAAMLSLLLGFIAAGVTLFAVLRWIAGVLWRKRGPIRSGELA